MSFRVLLAISFLSLLPGCSAYKQNIMFRTPEGYSGEAISDQVLIANKNYIIQKNDFLELVVYSNNGEKLIDPNPELTQTPNTQTNTNSKIQYLVDINGIVKFPLVGELKLEGLTLRQAELIIQKEYEKYYKSPFVLLSFNNKRVIVLGASGGKVIPLVNDGTSISEVIALAQGINTEGKAHNIRLIRGEKVFLIDLSTIEGYQKGNIIVEPNDIVYIEPVRKPIAEGFRDYSIIITFLVSITTLITLLTR